MIRFGVVGTNWITERFIEAAKQTEHFQLTAVYSRTEDRAKQFACKFGVERIFTDLKEMARSKEIDAVYIASPNSLHREQSVLFMNHQKHVLCEKPLASNQKEVEQMVEAARKNKVLLMEAMKTTLVPNFQVIQNHLHKLGTVRRYFASYCQYSSRYDQYKLGNVLNAFDPTFSNGSLMDIGIYCIYPLVVLFGKPKEIKATGYKLATGVDAQGSVAFLYDEMEAVIMHSKISNSALPVEIQGENATMIMDKVNTPRKVQINYKDGTIENISVSQQHSNDMFYEIDHFINCIKNGQLESPINSHQHSILTTEILETARKQVGVKYIADE